MRPVKCSGRYSGCERVARPGRKQCATCAKASTDAQRGRREAKRAAAPAPPPSGTRLRSSPTLLARRLKEIAADAAREGLHGSAARLRELAAELYADPTVARAGATARLVAEAAAHARACVEEEDGEVDVLVAVDALAVWERAKEVAA